MDPVDHVYSVYIKASPERIWRDLLFVCDEYHAFGTVGETDPTGDERTFALSRQGRAMETIDDMAGLVKERPGLKAGAVWSETCIFCHNVRPSRSSVQVTVVPLRPRITSSSAASP